MNWELSVTIYLCLGYAWTYYTLWRIEQVKQGKIVDTKTLKKINDIKGMGCSDKVIDAAITITGVITVFLWPLCVLWDLPRLLRSEK